MYLYYFPLRDAVKLLWSSYEAFFFSESYYEGWVDVSALQLYLIDFS